MTKGVSLCRESGYFSDWEVSKYDKRFTHVLFQNITTLLLSCSNNSTVLLPVVETTNNLFGEDSTGASGYECVKRDLGGDSDKVDISGDGGDSGLGGVGDGGDSGLGGVGDGGDSGLGGVGDGGDSGKVEGGDSGKVEGGDTVLYDLPRKPSNSYQVNSFEVSTTLIIACFEILCCIAPPTALLYRIKPSVT